MTAVTFESRERCDRLGLKGPRAAEWLDAQEIELPMSPNTWTYARATAARADAMLVARLGSSEFFLEDDAGATRLARLGPHLDRPPPGVYPFLREDAEFSLAGDAVHEVLAQVCNVNFAALPVDARPVIMTLMIGVSVLIVPQAAVHGRLYRIWCDPTFGFYLGESLAKVVVDCGGSCTGVSG
jgi:sarcosine oxidase subunit gamma